MNDDLLARACPVCDAMYGEHTLDELAECMEVIVDERPMLGVVGLLRVETVTGPTAERVL